MRAGGETAPARTALVPIVLRDDGWDDAAGRMLAPYVLAQNDAGAVISGILLRAAT